MIKRAKKGSVRSWLQSNVAFSDVHNCLEFPFARTKSGRGCICFDGETLAHRWMCRAAHGPAPEAKPMALHSCGNGHIGCVNPKHLYWGSGEDNYQDQVRHGVAARGERVGRATLNAALVIEIREMAARGLRIREIAAVLGLHFAAVRSVVRRRTWAWL